jgi:methylmalonyl-CoA/ethylmalonyl-CoA epimerase
MKILGLDHVSIATDSLDSHAAILEKLLGIKNMAVEVNKASKVRLSFFNLGNTELELVEPLDAGSAISKYLKSRGPGIHHICLLVENIKQALEELIAKEIKLIDEEPRRGAEGSLIAFIHPDSAGGILIELKEIISQELL